MNCKKEFKKFIKIQQAVGLSLHNDQGRTYTKT